jgi:hypothetical protein
MKTSFRTVPDTNVIIAAQNGSPTSPNREYFTRWENEEFVLLFSDDTLHEYIEKLTERNSPEELIVELIVTIWKLGNMPQFNISTLPITLPILMILHLCYAPKMAMPPTSSAMISIFWICRSFILIKFARRWTSYQS